MKLILCSAVYCSVAWATSNNEWDDCERSPNVSPTTHGEFFRPDPKDHPTTLPQQAGTSGTEPKSVPHYVAEASSTSEPEENNTRSKHKTPTTDKNQNVTWNFVTSYKFVIPCCISVISYIAYRCLKKH